MAGTEQGERTGRACILQEARRLFALHGYHGVSIRDIVHACGLSNAALYYHFGSKKNLYLEVLQAHVTAVAHHIRQAGAGAGTCRERLTRAAAAYAHVIVESQSVIQTLLRDLAAFDRREIEAMLPDIAHDLPGAITEILADGVAAGELARTDSQRIATLLMGMVNALVTWRFFYDADTSLEEDVALAIDVLFEGIESRDRGGPPDAPAGEPE